MFERITTPLLVFVFGAAFGWMLRDNDYHQANEEYASSIARLNREHATQLEQINDEKERAISDLRDSYERVRITSPNPANSGGLVCLERNEFYSRIKRSLDVATKCEKLKADYTLLLNMVKAQND